MPKQVSKKPSSNPGFAMEIHGESGSCTNTNMPSTFHIPQKSYQSASQMERGRQKHKHFKRAILTFAEGQLKGVRKDPKYTTRKWAQKVYLQNVSANCPLQPPNSFLRIEHSGAGAHKTLLPSIFYCHIHQTLSKANVFSSTSCGEGRGNELMNESLGGGEKKPFFADTFFHLVSALNIQKAG